MNRRLVTLSPVDRRVRGGHASTPLPPRLVLGYGRRVVDRPGHAPNMAWTPRPCKGVYRAWRIVIPSTRVEKPNDRYAITPRRSRQRTASTRRLLASDLPRYRYPDGFADPHGCRQAARSAPPRRRLSMAPYRRGAVRDPAKRHRRQRGGHRKNRRAVTAHHRRPDDPS